MTLLIGFSKMDFEDLENFIYIKRFPKDGFLDFKKICYYMCEFDAQFIKVIPQYL
jgi:hypothetical protein